ncbi:hypothetical protein J0K78_17020 [Halobacillus sp. GSS1]|uniref:hypothetical protein n=1 Tax=Halobacillus sp. GSS1 TaxID=2815919 RepID=UPI001A8CBD64|nr:hypothetical protein [Halobacillus sp. GSS1]MBN9655980.1 hypothetical protein [Halobacillus sp. GSS1]
MEQTVFLFKPYENYKQHSITNLPAETAEKLKAEGKATEISLGKHGEYRKKADELTANFKKGERAVKESDNPYYQQDAVRKYELDKLWNEYESETKALQAEYAQYRADQLEHARRKAAQAQINVTDTDKRVAEQMANRLKLNISQISNSHDLSVLLGEAEKDISYLSDAQKTAFQGYIGDVINQVEEKAGKYDDPVRTYSLVSSVQDVRNMDLLSVKAAEQLPERVDINYRQTALIRKKL